MDGKKIKMTSKCSRKTDLRVKFCEECVPGFKCKVCDKTFETNGKFQTTSYHQLEKDFTNFLVKKHVDMIADIGCPNTVIGNEDMKRFIENLSSYQQDNLEIHEVDENFKFGPSGPYRCFKRLKFPLSTSTKSIVAEVAIVEANIPMLLGNNIFKPLEAEIKLFSEGNGVLRLKDVDIDLKETAGGHYTVKVSDIASLCTNAYLLSKHITCEMCGFIAEDKNGFKSHMEKQHEGNQAVGRFKCKGCDFNTNSEIELEKHILDKHWDKQYKCEKCGFTTGNVKDYNVHIESKHVVSKLNKDVKSALKTNKPTKDDIDEDDICFEEMVKDMNTLLNGSRTRDETRLYSAVMKLVKLNQKQTVKTCDKSEYESKTEDNLEKHLKGVDSIFLSHHSEFEDEDCVMIDGHLLDVFFMDGDDDDKKELSDEEKNEVLKLHKYFAHRSGRKLWENLFQPAGKMKGKKKLILDFLNKCETCRKYKRTPARPKVGLPKSKDINDIVSMDLKIMKKSGNREVAILYLHDEFSKLVKGQVINDKNRDTIISAIENKWIVGGGMGPGHPTRGFFSDNGGEFLNEDLIDFASSLNITIKMTSASSPWSNGSCERAHATVDRIVEKILEDDPKTSLQKAVDLACFVKNTEINKTGFSPIQLFTGKSPSFPGLSDCSPANVEMEGNNEFLKILRRMDKVRIEARKVDCDQRMKTALRSKINSSCQRSYFFGDSVWFKLDSSHRWKSGTVLGQDGKVLFLRYGNFIRSYHSC